MAIGEPQPELDVIDILNWEDLYNGTIDNEDAVIDNIAFRGRWTAIVSPAKAGKSTFILGLAVEAAKTGLTVLYLDAEMGRSDVQERVADWMDLKPGDLKNLHYSDLAPKLDNIQGAQRLANTIAVLEPDLVVLDGLNGFVNGAENDDTPWRDLFEWAISPAKIAHVAVLSADNTGHTEKGRPRGSSVKLDKADAILAMVRTDTGVKLTATFKRSGAYPDEQEYTVTDASEEGPPMSITPLNGHATPAGTARICNILDQLGAPLDIGRRVARDLLKANHHDAPRNADLGIMLRWRRENAGFDMTRGAQLIPIVVPGNSGTTGDHCPRVVPESGDHSQETPGRSVVPDRGSPRGPSLSTGPEKQAGTGTTPEPEADFIEPF